jgi:phosphoribosyl 1,2-cyclic phosphodiesterase
MEDVGKFYGHLVYITAIGYFCGHFDVFYGHSVHFPVLVCCRHLEKSGNPASHWQWSRVCHTEQGDQIGQCFAYWVTLL